MFIRDTGDSGHSMAVAGTGGLKGISKLEEEMEHFKHENCTKTNNTEETLRHLYPSPFSKRADVY
jgi:hypothetical protein